MNRLIWVLLCAAVFLPAEVRMHAGGKEIPHDAYIRLIPEWESPVERVYVPTKDGLYVAAAIRRPQGPGPFPALVYFHGAPGGRGMAKLVDWSTGSTGSPVFERFLKEGFAVIIGDYRRVTNMGRPISPDDTTMVDDGMSILEYVRKLPYVDANNIHLYGVSLGGNVVAHMTARTKVRGAILGAAAVMSFLGVTYSTPRPPQDPEERAKAMKFDTEYEKKQIAAIQTPILILVGGKDSLHHINRHLHDLVSAAGKPVRMEFYENGYHDFCIGPQGHAGFHQPLMDSTLDALERTLEFVRQGIR